MAYTGVALNTDATLDLWKTTLSNYDWDNKTLEYLLPLHHFPVLDQMFEKNRVQVDSGTQIKRQLIYRENGSTQYINPGQVRTRSTIDVVTELTVPYACVEGDFSILEQEIRRNTGRAQLKKLASAKRVTALVDMYKSTEQRAWFLPDTSSNVYPWGFPYWIVPIHGDQVQDTGSYGSDVTGAFQGGIPSGFSDVAGIDPGAYSPGSGFDHAT